MKKEKKAIKWIIVIILVLFIISSIGAMLSYVFVEQLKPNNTQKDIVNNNENIDKEDKQNANLENILNQVFSGGDNELSGNNQSDNILNEGKLK